VFEQASGGDTHRPMGDGVPCECGHGREQHADAASGDTRCLVVAERERLTDVFDDGREGQLGYCACLGFREARQLSLDVEPTALERLGTTDAGVEERILDAQQAAQELSDKARVDELAGRDRDHWRLDEDRDIELGR
jgi:hypothetical protein